MCGLAGFVDFGRAMPPDEQRAICERMADSLAHRGPDDRGVWTDARAGVALGHRRLSILDLSPLGHQPMASESGRYIITYNGEVYDFAELRKELGAHRFRSGSDTEVVLAAFEEWGVEAALPRFNGMFAMAVWDAQERALWLARDRFGEKPLYYGRVGRALVFGSELKALRVFPGFRNEIDRDALAQLMRYGYVPAPASIFAGIRKLPGASFLRISADDQTSPTPAQYWSLQDVAHEGLANPFVGTDADAVAGMDHILRRAVKLQMVSDVPVGAFLSGGIDSSTVVSMMQATGSAKVKTFTIGFHDSAFNEAESAKAIAAHLGTDHTELYVTPETLRSVIPRLSTLYDEPFADSSQVPTFLVAQLARKQVTVALSGDGGDELLCGYNRYVWADEVWRHIQRLPLTARGLMTSSAQSLSPNAINRGFAVLDRVLPRSLRHRTPGDKLHKLAGVLSATTHDDLYLRLASRWQVPEDVVIGAERTWALQQTPLAFGNFIDRMMCTDTLTYLPDDILVKVDRAAMAVGLETRVPMLDVDVARFAWSLPRHMKLRLGKGKWVLREVLARYVPRPLFDRPKTGFAMPIDAWLRGPLRAWADEALSDSRLRSGGYLRAKPIRRRWTEHLSGKRNWQEQLWPVLIFQAWLENLPR